MERGEKMSNVARIFKTPKGTELPLMSLKGKEYMQIMYRWIWFEEENPRYDVSTDFVKLDDEQAIARCTISVLEDTPQGVRVVRKVTEYKKETSDGFPDFVEKACSGAAGRALIALGYGTQFAAADLDEGSRIVDSPVAPKASASSSMSVSTAETKSAVVPAMPPEKPASRFARKPASNTGGTL